MSERPRLILIDGHALAYRQFFALQKGNFTTLSGEPTNATWGFARTLLDLLQSATPPHFLAVTFDMGLSGREVLYPAYKTNREEMQDSLSRQIERIHEVVRAFNIPIFEMEGYEADDVIGTLVGQAVEQGAEVYIITGDRDLLQLVNEHITIELPPMGFEKETKIYTPEKVVEKFTVRPDQYVDYKGIVGDQSDNIPGVKGIGEKGAAQLLQQFGTLEGIYSNLNQITGKRREQLEQSREMAFLSRDLSRIMRDLPLKFDLQQCAAQDYDPAEVGKLFQILEFKGLHKRLGLAQSAATTAPVPAPAAGPVQQMSLFGDALPAASEASTPAEIVAVVPFEIVDTAEKLDELVHVLNAAHWISFDTETTSTDQLRAVLVGISLAVNGEKGYYIPVGHIDAEGKLLPQLPLETVIAALRPAMTDPSKPKCAHNAKYDLIVLRRHGLDVAPITFDTMLALWVLNPEQPKGLKEVVRERFHIEMTTIDTLIGRGKNQITMDRVAIERAAPYAVADAVLTFRLVEPLQAELQAHGEKLWAVFDTLEMPLVNVIANIDMAGVRLDKAFLFELSREFTQRMRALEEEIYDLAKGPFKISSPKQLNEVLFGRLGLSSDGLSKSVHGYSVDADTLETLSHQPGGAVAEKLLHWRTLEKLKNTYVDALPELVDAEGRVHTSYNQTGAVTGRMSSENPNLQNIPIRTEEGARVRRAFIASPGYRLLGVDYSQIELRILASFSNDAFLRDAFENDRDVHRATAAAVTGVPFDQVTKEQRYFAKRVNFGLMYGMGPHRLAQESGLSYSEAQKFIERYFGQFPGIKAYFDGCKKEAVEKGYLETTLGRRRYFPELQQAGRGASRARAEREAINMPIQGTAADIIKLAMLQLATWLRGAGSHSRLILQVHDELVLEVPESEIEQTAHAVKMIMETAPLEKVPLSVPLKAEAKVGLNWAEMTPIEG